MQSKNTFFKNNVFFNNRKLSWILLISSLTLRMFYILNFFDLAINYWFYDILHIGIYILSVFLIWFERKKLQESLIDCAALLIIIFFKPIQTLLLTSRGIESILAFPKPLSLIIWCSSLILTYLIISKKIKTTKINLETIKWIIIGILVGFVTAIFYGLLLTFNYKQASNINTVIKMAGIGFIYQIGFAAITEEPMFRGFLWGFLRDLKWKDKWINVFQIGLFTFAHLYYLKTSLISFFIIVPLGGLITGLLASKSNSIATSMVAHATMNALSKLIASVFIYYFS